MRHLSIVLSCVAFACSPLGSGSVPYALVNGTVSIETEEAYGTGAVVRCEPAHDGPGYIVHVLTAAHVEVPGAIVHPELDMELFCFRSDVPYQALDLRGVPPLPGDHLWCSGHPAALPLQVWDGYCGVDGWVGLPAFPGVSGGPVLDDDGRLVGIVVAVAAYDPGEIVYATCYVEWIDVGWIERAIKEAVVPARPEPSKGP